MKACLICDQKKEQNKTSEEIPPRELRTIKVEDIEYTQLKKDKIFRKEIIKKYRS